MTVSNPQLFWKRIRNPVSKKSSGLSTTPRVIGIIMIPAEAITPYPSQTISQRSPTVSFHSIPFKTKPSTCPTTTANPSPSHAPRSDIAFMIKVSKIFAPERICAFISRPQYINWLHEKLNSREINKAVVGAGEGYAIRYICMERFRVSAWTFNERDGWE